MSDSARIHRPLYRVFHLNSDGGIVRADIIEAHDDENAIDRIRALADDHAIELWDRARFVAKIEPPPSAIVPEPIVVRNDREPIAVTVLETATAEPAKLVH